MSKRPEEVEELLRQMFLEQVTWQTRHIVLNMTEAQAELFYEEVIKTVEKLNKQIKDRIDESIQNSTTEKDSEEEEN